MKKLTITSCVIIAFLSISCNKEEESQITIVNEFKEDVQAYLCVGSSSCGVANDYFINTPPNETRSENIPNGTYYISISAKFSDDDIPFQEVFSVDNENYTITYFGE